MPIAEGEEGEDGEDAKEEICKNEHPLILMHTLPSAYDEGAEAPTCSKCSNTIEDVTVGIWHCESEDATCTTDICIDCKPAPVAKETE